MRYSGVGWRVGREAAGVVGVVAVVGVGVAALVFPGDTGEKAWMAVALSVVGFAVWVLFASRSALRR